MKRLDKDNIVQVIFGIGFVRKIFTVEELNEVRKSFYYDWISKDNFNVTINDRLNAPVDVTKTRVGFTITKDLESIILDEQRIVLIQNPPYNGGEATYKSFSDVLSNLSSICDKINTIAFDFGIRYINRMVIDKDRFETDDFKFLHVPSLGLKDNKYVIQRLINDDEISHILHVIVEHANSKQIVLTVDIDTHTQLNNRKLLEEKFGVIREAKNRLFLALFPNVEKMKEFHNE